MANLESDLDELHMDCCIEHEDICRDSFRCPTRIPEEGGLPDLPEVDPELPEVDPDLPQGGPAFECMAALLQCAFGKGLFDSDFDAEFESESELEDLKYTQMREECCMENELVCAGFSICNIEPLLPDDEVEPVSA